MGESICFVLFLMNLMFELRIYQVRKSGFEGRTQDCGLTLTFSLLTHCCRLFAAGLPNAQEPSVSHYYHQTENRWSFSFSTADCSPLPSFHLSPICTSSFLPSLLPSSLPSFFMLWVIKSVIRSKTSSFESDLFDQPYKNTSKSKKQ